MASKNIQRRLANWAAIALVVALLYVFIVPSYMQGEPSLAGKKANDFTFPVDGRQARLSEFRGRVVVLNFWASYCDSCVVELPDLDRLQARIRSRGGTVLAASIDENCGEYDNFLKKYPVRFQTTCEPTKKVSLGYGTVMIPETYVIDRQGRILRKIIGPQQWDSAEMTHFFDTTLAGG